MKSIHTSKLISQEIWPDFTAHFKSGTTKGSYESDISEIMDYFEKDFLEIGKGEIQEYFEMLQDKIVKGEIKASTAAKKIRELHSFAEYICENKDQYGVVRSYEDVYEPYLQLVEKQKKFVNYISIDYIDRLLKNCEDDLMPYTILVLIYRAGLTSTEITELKREDFAVYANGMYVELKRRRGLCYVPEDAAKIVELYLKESQEREYMFYNSRGNRLNLMYISRMMKRIAHQAGVPECSAESLRNASGVTMYAYGGSAEQVADKLGITQTQVHRYKDMAYRDGLKAAAERLVRVKILPPGEK